jgi:hypothetical protein
MFSDGNNNNLYNEELYKGCGSSSNNFNNLPQGATRSTNFNSSLNSNSSNSNFSYQEARKRANEILQKSK